MEGRQSGRREADRGEVPARNWPWLNGSMPDMQQMVNVMANLAARPAKVSLEAFFSLSDACLYRPHSVYEANHARQYAAWALRIAVFSLHRGDELVGPLVEGMTTLLREKTNEAGYYFCVDTGPAEDFVPILSTWLVHGTSHIDPVLILDRIFEVVPKLPVSVGAFFILWIKVLLYELPSSAFWLSETPLPIPEAFCSWLIERFKTIGFESGMSAHVFEHELLSLTARLLRHPPTANHLISKGVLTAQLQCAENALVRDLSIWKRVARKELFEFLHSVGRLELTGPILTSLAAICDKLHASVDDDDGKFVSLLECLYIAYGYQFQPVCLDGAVFNQKGSALARFENERIAFRNGTGISQYALTDAWIHNLASFHDSIIRAFVLEFHGNDGEVLLHVFLAKHHDGPIAESYWLLRRWIPANVRDNRGRTPMCYSVGVVHGSLLLNALAHDDDLDCRSEEASVEVKDFLLQDVRWDLREYQDAIILAFAEKGAFRTMHSSREILASCTRRGMFFTFIRSLFRVIWLSGIPILNRDEYNLLTSPENRAKMTEDPYNELVRMLRRAHVAILLRFQRGALKAPMLSYDLTHVLLDVLG